jgi:hypothetical protein
MKVKLRRSCNSNCSSLANGSKPFSEEMGLFQSCETAARNVECLLRGIFCQMLIKYSTTRNSDRCWVVALEQRAKAVYVTGARSVYEFGV